MIRTNGDIHVSESADLLRRIEKMFFILFPLTVVLWWINDGYRGMDFTTSVVFFGADSNCRGEYRIIGHHCFGDYEELVRLAKTSNPWNGVTANSIYPAITILLYKPFVLVSDILGYRESYIAFLLTQLAAASAPLIYLTRQFGRKHWPLLFLVCGPLTIPFLAAYDRGQSVVWLVPPILLFLQGVGSGRFNLAVLGAVTASFVRPHFALLGVFFLLVAEWRRLTQFLMFSIGGQIVGWLFYWEVAASAIPQNLKAVIS